MSLVLLSGGMDSTTLLTVTLEDSPNGPVEAVFVDYGQRHIREYESAQAVAARFGIRLHVIDLRAWGACVKSALTDPDIAVPHGHYTADTMAITVVPNRNATMLSAAAGIAASRDLGAVRTAVHAGDHAVYADCRPEFITALSAATLLGCGIRIQAPFVQLDKTAIANLAYEFCAPHELTWSCYEGGEQHCGRCGTCCERAEAFHLAGVPDPTEYADTEFWKQACAEANAKAAQPSDHRHL
jgi:7-cyano-7-deazaguanine synthase